jgi:hypothetical protein
VSRSSTDTLAIGLGTCDVAVGRRRRSWLRRAAREAAPCAVRIVEIESARRYTDAGLFDAFGRALDDASTDASADAEGGSPSSVDARTGPRRAAIVLDDFWGRHAILRGDFRSLRARDLDEVAGAYFADTFGVDGATLIVRWQVQPGGRTLFASALPRALVEGIREKSAEARVDVASIVLALPRTLNRVRSAIGDGGGWLLVATDTLLHAVTIGKGGWSAYDTERVFRDGSEEGDAGAHAVADAARQIFERSAAARGAECGVYLCGLALDPEPFERSFARFTALHAHMSSAPPALGLMELAS